MNDTVLLSIDLPLPISPILWVGSIRKIEELQIILYWSSAHIPIVIHIKFYWKNLTLLEYKFEELAKFDQLVSEQFFKCDNEFCSSRVADLKHHVRTGFLKLLKMLGFFSFLSMLPKIIQYFHLGGGDGIQKFSNWWLFCFHVQNFGRKCHFFTFLSALRSATVNVCQILQIIKLTWTLFVLWDLWVTNYNHTVDLLKFPCMWNEREICRFSEVKSKNQ